MPRARCRARRIEQLPQLPPPGGDAPSAVPRTCRCAVEAPPAASSTSASRSIWSPANFVRRREGRPQPPTSIWWATYSASSFAQRRHRDDRRGDPSRPFGRSARTTFRPSRCTTTCSTNGLGSSTCTTGPRAWSQSRPAAPAGFHSSARNCPSRDQPLTDAPLRRTIGVTRVRQVVVALSRDVAPGYVGPRSQAQSDHAPASTASSRGSAFGWRWTSRPRDYLPKSRRACTSSWPRH